jgi:DNA repair protein RadD
MLSGGRGDDHASARLAEPDAKACVLAHRDELTGPEPRQVRPRQSGLTTSVFDAHEKSWAGNATFAMVQTLSGIATSSGCRRSISW